ncbi:hypothetical protein GCM10010256_06380 [Streptomyces coeruleorubidus]|nr:hypothetical protein GCM10010256_06380 [Streptomyces coeruleorubidus]
MVAAAEEEGYQDGLRVSQGGERVGEQGGVQFDVPEVHRHVGAQRADPVQERAYGAQRTGVAAAVRHDHEGGRGRAARGGLRDEAELTGHATDGRRRTLPSRCVGVTGVFRRFTMRDSGGVRSFDLEFPCNE